MCASVAEPIDLTKEALAKQPIINKSKYRVTVEPLGFIYLTAGIIQVKNTILLKSRNLNLCNLPNIFIPSRSWLLICTYTKYALSILTLTRHYATLARSLSAIKRNYRIEFKNMSVLWIFTARSSITCRPYSWCFFYWNGAIRTVANLWWLLR